MKVVDAVARILKIEGAEFLSAYPTTPVIEAAAEIGIRPVLCRQERVGVGIADGYARVTNGKPLGVFAMQYGPGAENAFPGVATAYSDSTPMLVLPLGHPRDRAQVFPLFSSARTYASVTKSVETITLAQPGRGGHAPGLQPDAHGPAGAGDGRDPGRRRCEEVPDALIEAYRPVKATSAGANARDVDAAARVLRGRATAVIHAGQGVLYAEATDELLELAELLQMPVMTTLEGKSAFPEDHPLALGTGGPAVTGPAAAVPARGRRGLRRRQQLHRARHGRHHSRRARRIIHATNDERDLQQELRRRSSDARRRQAGAAPVHRGGEGSPGRPPGRTRAACAARSSSMRAAWLERVDAEADLGRGADEPVPRDLGVHAAR